MSEALIFHQLTHNMMTNCSLFMKVVSSEYLQYMLCTQIVVFGLFWHSGQFWYTTCSADVASFWKRFTCNENISRKTYSCIKYLAVFKQTSGGRSSFGLLWQCPAADLRNSFTKLNGLPNSSFSNRWTNLCSVRLLKVKTF